MVKSSWLNVLLVAAPLGLVAEHMGWGASAIFLLVRRFESDVNIIQGLHKLAAAPCFPPLLPGGLHGASAIFLLVRSLEHALAGPIPAAGAVPVFTLLTSN